VPTAQFFPGNNPGETPGGKTGEKIFSVRVGCEAGMPIARSSFQALFTSVFYTSPPKIDRKKIRKKSLCQAPDLVSPEAPTRSPGAEGKR
jgi:hypothetical protein